MTYIAWETEAGTLVVQEFFALMRPLTGSPRRGPNPSNTHAGNAWPLAQYRASKARGRVP
ncbi:hypothetical protein KDH_46560 [Dictyobacter sp. S3.2.2.5]|uniref:Uncharacterized protein n=1 Tax=Dictyobacter halimunensis TaxID=3026934 RepID=A0ABQ6FXT6_9CHLR|nr:hypothetical protein KDH_46560 [Dictyobacter sp. S3.2.2.5]